MSRPAIGTAVREGRREGVVVAHAGRGSMVDVQFADVDFVEPLNAYLAHKKNTVSFRRRADAETPHGSTRGLRSGQARGGTG